MSRAVIYTCVTGGYDTLLQPVTAPEFDYVCFVEKGRKTEEKSGVWTVREIPYEGNCKDMSRFPKLNPHLVFPEYDYSIWMDGNVTIDDAGAYRCFEEKMERGVLYSGMKHWLRDCAYDEALACIDARKAWPWDVLRTVRFLKSEGFPEHFGLYENNVILRRHNDPAVIGFDRMWWKVYNEYLHRDQVLHPYCMWKCGMGFDYLLPEEFSARNHAYFVFKDRHNVRKSVFPRFLAGFVRRAVSLIV